ncbi:MAG TPA: hypothetical protein VI542_36045 [Candidatus Tectomicrobia bacterium]
MIVPLEHMGLVATVCRALLESTAEWWVKRGDVHAIQSDDVLFVRIDINDWPSFRGCRPVAATHMAQQRGLL